MPMLTVVVPTLNEEKNIERCLRSVDWADEIVLVDSFSTDRTIELSRQFTSKIYQYDYPGYSKQVERGIAHASGDWIFILDADEEVSKELSAAIRSAIEDPAAADGYFVNRKVEVFGKWIEHCGWFPDWQFRLGRKANLVAEHQEVHGAFKTHGCSERLEGLLYHYTYSSIFQYLEKMNDYTSLHVSNKLRDDPELQVVWHKVVVSPLSNFLRMFFVNKGYRDGMHGFLLSVYSALYTLLLYAKVWEYQFRRSKGELLPPIKNAEVTAYRRRYAPFLHEQ